MYVGGECKRESGRERNSMQVTSSAGQILSREIFAMGAFPFLGLSTLKYTYQKHHEFPVANLTAKKSPLN